MSPQSYALAVSVDVTYTGKGVRLLWPYDTARVTYRVFRKDLTGTRSKSFTPFARRNYFVDTTASLDGSLQYIITKVKGTVLITGKIIPYRTKAPRPSEGRVILVVQDTLLARLGPELAQMREDMGLDGWTSTLLSASPTETPPQIKARILAEYAKDTNRTNAVFLIGYVPIPYSGDLELDGHGDHRGAWPADPYYSDVRGTWTDSIANVSGVGSAITTVRNVPGDGKFDNNTPPSNAQIRLGVGRIIFNALPVYSQANPAWTDVELTRRYLQKLHRYKTGAFQTPPRMLIDDTFYPFNNSRLYAKGEWVDGQALFGSSGMGIGTTLTELTGPNRWLISYMSGPGGWDNCGNVATAGQLVAADSLNAVFTKAYGSYFGDWFLPNNFLRALIASKGGILAASWSGLYTHEYAEMAAGHPLARVARRIMGYTGDTNYVSSASTVTGILGDVTLHLRYIRPATGARAALVPGGGIRVDWQASPDVNNGYYIYRSSSADGFFRPITPAPVTGLSFTDSTPLAGSNVYQVRAVRFENNTAGFTPIVALGAQSNAVSIDVIKRWAGTAGSAWKNDANWSPPGIPRTGDTVVVQAGPPAPVLVGKTEIRSLYLGPGAGVTLSAGSELALNGHAAGPGAPTGAGMVSFVPGEDGHLLAWGTDTLELERLRLKDPMGLRLVKPLRITTSLRSDTGSIDCNHLPLRLVSTARRSARLEVMARGANFFNASRFEFEKYVPPVPTGAAGSWHFLTATLPIPRVTVFRQNNPYLPGTFSPRQSLPSSMYKYFDVRSDTGGTMLNHGWYKFYLDSGGYIPTGEAQRVWIRPTAQFREGGPSTFRYLGKPTLGTLLVRTQNSKRPLMPDDQESLTLLPNPYPCPILPDPTGTAPLYRFDAATQRFAIYGGRFGTINGGSPVIPSGEAAFMHSDGGTQYVYKETMKYTADTLPRLGGLVPDGLLRLRIYLKDTAVRSEAMLVLDPNTSVNQLVGLHSYQLWTGGPTVGIKNQAVNWASILPLDTAFGGVGRDTLWIGTYGIESRPARLIFRNEGPFPLVFLYDTANGSVRLLDPAGDSISVSPQPGTHRRYALVRYRGQWVGNASHLPDDFRLSPIPTTDYLSIHTSAAGRLELLGIDGRPLHIEMLPPGTHRLTVTHLPPGIYLARLNGRVRRWIKE